MRHPSAFFLAVALFLSACANKKEAFITKTASEGGFTFEYVEGDPMKTRIYTLDNGLKVYLSDYKSEPRIQVYIPVKAGGKNDPASNTGLAHYLEHMMFKGNDKFGTVDYEVEKIMLDSIERMFNYYATLTDAQDRKNYYAKIDAYSNEAARLAIPNEYDKIIATIGGKSLNAYTTEDRTVYTVDIPANELGRFLEIEGSRFRQIVNRLFHTELEAVYEEKNMSLDNDYWKVFETMYAAMFKQHPYGTQTVIGTIEHLKNPSITEIKNYFNTYYKPNNVAICMSGDLDFTETITLITKHFGDWRANDALPTWSKVVEAPITASITKEVIGPDAEFIQLGFRFDGTNSEELLKVKLVDMLLNNAEAGLIDLNIKQKQTALDAGSFVNDMNDYSIHTFYGYAKQNQSLDEVKKLILEQINLLKSGQFEDWLLDAVINDFKKSQMMGLESNASRANSMVMAFTNDIKWADQITQIQKMSKITKEELIAFANEKYLDNYVVVYKRSGEDPNKLAIEKPQITKVPLNRDVMSDFHKAIVATEVNKLSPVFVNFSKDIRTSEVKIVEVLSKQNTENSLFELTYLLDLGKNADQKIGIAVQYLEFLGNGQFTAEEIRKEFYKIGCSFSVTAGDERTYITLSGLDENMEAATKLFESLLSNPVADDAALAKMIDRMLKSRSDAKKNKAAILWNGLFNYAKYGAENPFTNTLDNYELKQISADELTTIIKNLTRFPHKVLYYGPRSSTSVKKFVSEFHAIPTQFDSVPPLKRFAELPIDQPQVFWTDYDMTQTEIVFLAKSQPFDASLAPGASMYNEYFGGGMNSIVFQEIREAQGLAYSVFSSYDEAAKKDRSNYLFAYIGTQADKQPEAMAAMMELLNNMPESQDAFKVAKEAILNKIESERITKSDVIWSYIRAADQGIDYDIRRDIYNDVKAMTFENLKAFQEKYIKYQKYTTVLVGSRKNINFNDLAKYGTIKEVKLDELFGYEDTEAVDIKK